MPSMTFRTLPRAQLEEHPLADRVMPARQIRVLAAWIKRTGFYPPVTVMCDPAGERARRYIILDGRARVRALTRLKHKSVLCAMVHVTGPEALWLLATLNTLHGCEDPLARGKLLRQFNLSHRQLGVRIGQDPRTVRRFMRCRRVG